jgi:hypothetical protein
MKDLDAAALRKRLGTPKDRPVLVVRRQPDERGSG